MMTMTIGASTTPFLADWLKKPDWKITHPDPVLLEASEDELASDPTGVPPAVTPPADQARPAKPVR
jgi:hypothetical protein